MSEAPREALGEAGVPPHLAGPFRPAPRERAAAAAAAARPRRLPPPRRGGGGFRASRPRPFCPLGRGGREARPLPQRWARRAVGRGVPLPGRGVRRPWGGGGPRGEGPAPGTGGGVEEASRSGERRGVAPPRLAWSGAGGRGPPRGGSEFGGPAGLQGTSAARCGTPSYQNTGATSPSDKEMTCTADSDNGCLSRLA